MRYFITIILILLLSACGAKFTGKNVREIKYGMNPKDVHAKLNSSPSFYMPFLLKVDGISYRYMAYSTGHPYPALNLLFENEILAGSVLDTPKADEIQRLFNGEKIDLYDFKDEYNSNRDFNFDKLLLAPFVLVGNIGQFKNDEILLNINLGVASEKVISILGKPSRIEMIGGSTLYIYEAGKLIGQSVYVLSIENSRLESILRVVLTGDFSKEHYLNLKAKYIELINKSLTTRSKMDAYYAGASYAPFN